MNKTRKTNLRKHKRKTHNKFKKLNTVNSSKFKSLKISNRMPKHAVGRLTRNLKNKGILGGGLWDYFRRKTPAPTDDQTYKISRPTDTFGRTDTSVPNKNPKKKYIDEKTLKQYEDTYNTTSTVLKEIPNVLELQSNKNMIPGIIKNLTSLHDELTNAYDDLNKHIAGKNILFANGKLLLREYELRDNIDNVIISIENKIKELTTELNQYNEQLETERQAKVQEERVKDLAEAINLLLIYDPDFLKGYKITYSDFVQSNQEFVQIDLDKLKAILKKYEDKAKEGLDNKLITLMKIFISLYKCMFKLSNSSELTDESIKSLETQIDVQLTSFRSEFGLKSRPFDRAFNNVTYKSYWGYQPDKVSTFIIEFKQLFKDWVKFKTKQINEEKTARKQEFENNQFKTFKLKYDEVKELPWSSHNLRELTDLSESIKKPPTNPQISNEVRKSLILYELKQHIGKSAKYKSGDDKNEYKIIDIDVREFPRDWRDQDPNEYYYGLVLLEHPMTSERKQTRVDDIMIYNNLSEAPES